MEFITLSSAARKWQLSELVVQHYCATQRIPGATQRDGTWVIPADAQKPSAPEQAAPTSAPITPMPLLNTIFTPGNCQAAVEQIQDPHTKAIAQAEYAYFSGQAQTAAQIAELYLYHPDLNLRLSACLIYAYANLTLERPLSTRMALEEVRNIFLATDETTPPALRPQPPRFLPLRPSFFICLCRPTSGTPSNICPCCRRVCGYSLCMHRPTMPISRAIMAEASALQRPRCPCRQVPTSFPPSTCIWCP